MKSCFSRILLVVWIGILVSSCGSSNTASPPREQPLPAPPPPTPTEAILGVTTDDEFDLNDPKSVFDHADEIDGSFSLITAGLRDSDDGIALWSKALSPTASVDFDGDGNAQVNITFSNDEVFQFEVPNDIVFEIVQDNLRVSETSENSVLDFDFEGLTAQLVLDFRSPYVVIGRILLPDSDGPAQSVFGTSYFVFGLRTADSDMPMTGTARYDLRVELSNADHSLGSIKCCFDGSGSLTADFGSGAITVELLAIFDDQLFTLDGIGELFDGTSSFSGSLSSGIDADVEGAFHGTFFGPADPNPVQVAGTYTAVSGNFSSAGRFVGIDSTAALDELALVTGFNLDGGTVLEVDTSTGVTQIDPKPILFIGVNNDFLTHSFLLSPSTEIENVSINYSLDETTKEGADLVVDGNFRLFDGTQVGSRIEVTAPLSAINDTDPDFFLNYATFGRWMIVGQGDQSARQLEAYTFGGRQTQFLEMPTTGSATYDVAVVGTAYRSVVSGLDSDSFELSGRGNLTADFEDLSINGTIGTLTGVAIDGSGETITISGFALDLSIPDTGGASFSGTANAFFGDAAVTGDSNGKFFGPNAEEIAGSWNLTDQADPNFAAQGVFLGRQDAP